MSQFEIRPKGNGATYIGLDGEELPGVLSYRIESDGPRTTTRVGVTLAIREQRTVIDDVLIQVDLSDDVRDALVRLGWTPPKENTDEPR